MRAWARAGALVTAVLLSACQAATTGASRVQPDQSAALMTTRAAIGVFLNVCMNGVTDEPKMVRALREYGFVQAPPAAAAPFLRGSAGTAWMRTDPAAVALPVVGVLRPGGVQCEVLARLTEPATAAALFDEMMQSVAGAPLVIRKERDERRGPDGGPGRVLLYRFGVPSASGGSFIAAMSARPPVEGGIAMLMTVSRTNEPMR